MRGLGGQGVIINPGGAAFWNNAGNLTVTDSSPFNSVINRFRTLTPARLESLSRQAGLSPTDVHRQAEADKLAQLKSGAAKPAAAAPAAPSPAVNPAVDDDVAAMPEAPR